MTYNYPILSIYAKKEEKKNINSVIIKYDFPPLIIPSSKHKRKRYHHIKYDKRTETYNIHIYYIREYNIKLSLVSLYIKTNSKD